MTAPAETPLDDGTRHRAAQARRARLEAWLGIGSPVALVLLWQLLVSIGVLDWRYFSSPVAVAKALVELIGSGELWRHLSVSLVRIVLGLLLGVIPGVLIGLTMGLFPLVRAALRPIVSAIYPIPKLALLPLILLIFGLTETSKVVIIAIGVFFPVLINTVAGVVNIAPIYIDVARTFNASRLDLYRTVALPGALPVIFAGLEIAVSVALLLIVAAEFVGAKSGIGYLVWNAWQIFEVDVMFAGLVVISVLGYLTTTGLHALRRRLIPWP